MKTDRMKTKEERVFGEIPLLQIYLYFLIYHAKESLKQNDLKPSIILSEKLNKIYHKNKNSFS